MTHNFKLFALGSNGRGQLGIGHENDTATPQLCTFDEYGIKNIGKEDQIVKIVAGGNHTVVLFKSGAVFAAGSDEEGQCGLGEGAQTSRFKRVIVRDLENESDTSQAVTVLDVSATWEATFLLETNGRVFSFGKGSKGELGRGEQVTGTTESHLTMLPAFGSDSLKVTRLYGGMRHSVAITKDGEVYGWGSCRKDELGADLQHRKVLWRPEKLDVPFQCKEVAIGRSFTVLFGEAACLMLGQNQGLESVAELQYSPSGAITSGWSTVYALHDKLVKAFGRNDRGQFPLDDMPDLSKFAAGSEHCVGLTSTGQVVAWGWGEHGNCGQPTDSRGNVTGGWNSVAVPLDEDEFIIDVAAGCATSFIVVEKKPR